MTQAQRIIKYCAIALAALITVGILGGIYIGVGSVFGFFDSSDNLKEMTEINICEDFTEIEVDLQTVSLTVKRGDSIKAETNSKLISFTQENGKTVITEDKKQSRFGLKNNTGRLILTLPENMSLTSVKINSGAGKTDVAKLNCESLELKFGAGEVNLTEIFSTKITAIEGGAGKLNIENSSLNSLTLNMGVGEFDMIAVLLNECEINCGVGEVNITLLGTKDNYTVKVNKGLGEAVVDGKKIDGLETLGSGANKITVEGGVGEIKVNYE